MIEKDIQMKCYSNESETSVISITRHHPHKVKILRFLQYISYIIGPGIGPFNEYKYQRQQW